MKKIVLIHPKAPETYWKGTGVLGFLKKKAILPNVGLATVAALTPPNYEVKIVDEDFEEIDFNMKCDMVGISGYNIHGKRALEIAKEFRKRGVFTVGGGPFCTAHAEDCVNHFDALVCGEVENIWPEFLADWQKGKHQNYYFQKEPIDITISPVPRWDLLKLDKYLIASVQTSRGCPFDCEFCDVVAFWGRKIRHKGYDQIIYEIKVLVEKGVFEIILADDNLVGDKKFAKGLLKRLIDLNNSLKKPIRFFTQASLTMAQDEKLLDLFKEANFVWIFVGIETPNKATLLATNKGHNARLDILESVRRIHSRGIFILSGMVVGFDTDDLDVFDAQMEFLAKAGLPVPYINQLYAPRGTKLWDRLEKEGRLIPELKFGDFFKGETNFKPKLMTRKQLKENYDKLLKDVFSYSHTLKAFQSLINQVDLKKVKKHSPLSYVMELKNFRFHHVGTTIRLLIHFLLNRERGKRAFSRSVLKIALKKGLICFPWAIEILLHFKLFNDYLRHYEMTLSKSR